MRFDTIGALLQKARLALKEARSLGSTDAALLINHEFTDDGPRWGLALQGTFERDGERMCFMGSRSIYMIAVPDLHRSLDAAPNQAKAQAFREMLREFGTQARFAADFDTYDIDGLV